MVDSNKIFLTAKELARRWDVTYMTLFRMREAGIGPRYIRVGVGKRSIRYKITDVETYEKLNGRSKCSPLS